MHCGASLSKLQGALVFHTGEEVRASNVHHVGVCGGMQGMCSSWVHGYMLILDCTHCDECL